MDIRVINRCLAFFCKAMEIALLFKSRCWRQDLIPGIQILCRMLISGFHRYRRNIQHRGFGQHRIPHIHVVQKHQRRCGIPLIGDGICNAECVDIFAAGDGALQHQLSGEDTAIVDDSVDIDIFRILIPPDPLTRRIANGAVQGARFPPRPCRGFPRLQDRRWLKSLR